MAKLIKNRKADKYWKQTRSTIKNVINGISDLKELEELEIKMPDVVIYKQGDSEDKNYK